MAHNLLGGALTIRLARNKREDRQTVESTAYIWPKSTFVCLHLWYASIKRHTRSCRIYIRYRVCIYINIIHIFSRIHI